MEPELLGVRVQVQHAGIYFFLVLPFTPKSNNMYSQECPDPIQVTYGYAMDSKGRPQHLDVIVEGSLDPKRKKTPSP